MCHYRGIREENYVHYINVTGPESGILRQKALSPYHTSDWLQRDDVCRQVIHVNHGCKSEWIMSHFSVDGDNNIEAANGFKFLDVYEAPVGNVCIVSRRTAS